MTTKELSSLQSAFRSAMGGVCTPVSVVSTVEQGLPHGTTVSAFASLSLHPPMVLVSLDADSDLLRILRRTMTFGVNVLSSEQSALALRFATKGAGKFDGVDWNLQDGAARLAGIAAWVTCSVAAFVPGGDHVIALGHVRSAEDCATAALTYHRRTFGTHLQHAEVL